MIPHEFQDRTGFREWLVDGGFRDNFVSAEGKSHVASPIVWFTKSYKEGDPDPADIEGYLGGHDATMDWCRDFIKPCDNGSANDGQTMVDDGHKADHGYDYDLLVIGGGSGGMAAAKEAAALGAKVALCDFVKPSPQGTTWGLGGTCVNVGCIPKKLFHIGATMRETIKSDGSFYGIAPPGAKPDEMGQLEPTDMGMHWGVAKDNIQNYIRSLNFKYRVRLREKSVNYLNKLAKFSDKHTVEVVDKKGRTSSITASRFLVATGGRPSPIECEGGELAITSDDVFFLDKDPGKTLCVGASYISLECAGFLAGMGKDVTVAVRSILLRGFDRECSNRIGDYMKDHGVKFKNEVTPSKLEKEGEQIKVTFSDGTSEVYDTVLAAIGRYADTEKLGLESIGVETNPRNKKIKAKLEQSNVPNVYCVGDVMEVSWALQPLPRVIQVTFFFSLTYYKLHHYLGLPGIDPCRNPSWNYFGSTIVRWF